MSRLLIVGAGGFGRELFDAVQATPEFRHRHDIRSITFLDDAGTPAIVPQAPVVGSISGFAPEKGDVALCAIGSTEVRRGLSELLEARGLTFPAFVHSSAQVGPGNRLQDGVIVCASTVVTTDVEVGRHTHLNVACTIGHDVVLGDFSTLSPSCSLPGGVHVGTGCFFGTGAITLPRITVGDGATVGAGSVVIRNVPPGKTVFGNPAKVIW